MLPIHGSEWLQNIQQNFNAVDTAQAPGAVSTLQTQVAALEGQVGALEAQTMARGTHIVSAGEATANQASIATGLVAPAAFIVGVMRAGVSIITDAHVTISGANLIVADGAATYNMTAGDVITWVAF